MALRYHCQNRHQKWRFAVVICRFRRKERPLRADSTHNNDTFSIFRAHSIDLLNSMSLALTEFVAATCLFDPSESLLPFTVDGVLAGWVKKSFAERLEQWPEYFAVRPRGVGMLGHFESPAHRSAAMAEVVESLATETVINGWRGEQISVAESFFANALFHVERAASRHLGVTVYASHLNGLTVRGGVSHMWLATRADTKAVDPGKWDCIAAGRIPRATLPFENMIKEAFEEAGISAELMQTAKGAGAVRSKRSVNEGLHHEIVFVHDIMLPDSFQPINQDGEVAAFDCVPIAEVQSLLYTTPERFTPDAALVVIDCLIRHGNIASDRDHYLDLIHAMRP